MTSHVAPAITSGFSTWKGELQDEAEEEDEEVRLQLYLAVRRRHLGAAGRLMTSQVVLSEAEELSDSLLARTRSAS